MLRKSKKNSSRPANNQKHTDKPNSEPDYVGNISPLEQRIMLSATWVDVDGDPNGDPAPGDGGDLPDGMGDAPGDGDLFGDPEPHINTAPVAGDDHVITNEDSSVNTGNLLTNDVDIDGDTLTVENYTQGQHGTITYNNDGSFSYTPTANYNGTDSFSYTVTDGNGGTATAEVTITVNSVNDAPVAVNNSYSTNEDHVLTTGNVLANDTDLDGDTLTVSSFQQPAHGSVVYNGDGTFNYTPAANYNGSDSFYYTISDGNGGTATAKVSLTVNSVNDAPTVGSDSITVDEDSSVVTGNLLANDLDVDGNAIYIDGVTNPSHGSVIYNGDGSFVYTPDPDYNGTDSFTYTVKDGVGGVSTATVTVNVNAVNDNPLATDDRYVVQEDNQLITGNVLNNDTDLDGDALTVSSFEQPVHGTVTYNGDGTFTYTPDANYNGGDNFTYTVSDGNGGTSTATIRIGVRAVNDAPDGNSDTVNTTEDHSVITGNVLANDTDVDGDAIHISGFSQGSHGSVSNNGDGTFTYTPEANYNGTDSFTYTIIDGNNTEQTVTVNVNIDAANDTPEAEDETISILEDSTITTGNVLANDTDIDGDILSISGFSQGQHGTVSYNGDGTFNYTPDANYNGTDSFTYIVSDGNGGTTTGTMTIKVQSVNDVPVTVSDIYTTTEDTVFTTGNVLANDSDIENNHLGIAWYSQPEHGSVVSNGDGTFTYTPDENFHGQDSFTYTITDGRGEPQTETIILNVNSVNDGPDGGNFSYSTGQDDAITTGNVLATATDADGDTLSISAFSQGNNGTVIYNDDGTFTYTPNAGFSGNDSFSYTIDDGNGGTDTNIISVQVISDTDPVAVTDYFSTNYNTSTTTGNVLANDSDPEGDVLSITGFTQAQHGTISYNDNGTFNYTPNNGYSGTDTFTYTITDGNGNASTGTVKITVRPENYDPNARNDVFNATEDTALTTGNVFANDTDADGDAISLSSFTQAGHGNVVYNGNGTFSYTPDANFNGTDTFTYTISDGKGGSDTATVTIKVAAVTDNPDAIDDNIVTNEDSSITTGNVLANDIDIEGDRTLFVYDFEQPEHGSVVYNDNGTFTYTPDENYYGTDSFTYTIYDGEGGSDTATVNITVNSVNDSPEGMDESYSMDEDHGITTGNVLVKATDVEGDTITVSYFTQAGHGTVVYNNDGTFSYTPDANYHGSDSFTYTLSDGNGGTDTLTISLNVRSVNDAPVTTDDSVTVDEDGSIRTGNLLANDTDADGDNLLIYNYTQGSDGTVRYNGDGTFTYTPGENYNGSDSFTYTVIDGNGGRDTATVNITVNSVNDTPDAVDISNVIDEDTSFTSTNVFSLYDNVDVEELHIDNFSQGSHGSVVYNNDGTFTYTPDANYYGNDSFTYTIIDDSGATDTATISVVIRPVNDAPVAGDDVINAAEDTKITIVGLTNNDTDVDNNSLRIGSFTQAAHGKVTLNNNGSLSYLANSNYNGDDSFTYTVIDGQGGSDTATVSLNVAAVNDAPDARSDYYTLNEDTTYRTGNVFNNDIDVDGEAINMTSFGQASHGTVTYNGDGTFNYTTNANYNGTDKFCYTVTDSEGKTDTTWVNFTIRAVNDAPVASDDILIADEDTPLVTANVFANDYDVDGDSLSVSGFAQPEHGTIAYNGNGTFTYTPNANYYGNDSFTYTISDGKGGTDTCTMNITVRPINDAPTMGADSYGTNEDTPLVTGNVMANDSDTEGEALAFSGFSQPAHGTVSYNGDGTFTYTPNDNYNGDDSFSYTITDASGASTTQQVSIKVGAVNDGPASANDTINTNEDGSGSVNVLANDSDIDSDILTVSDFTMPEHGTVSYNANGTFTYTPDANYNGTDNFTYTISDGNGGFSTSTVNITVNAVNDAVVAGDDSVQTSEDQTVRTGNVLANDSDIDNDQISIINFTQGSHGTVVNNGDGSFSYSPDANYSGTDSFTYTITDGNGTQSTATVSVVINEVNDGPVTADDTFTTDEDTAIRTGNVLANDSDVDGDALTVTDFAQGSHGTVSYNGDGTFTYTPDENYHGSDSFSYTVSDGRGGTSTSTITINVNSVNDTVVANNDSAITQEDQVIRTGNVLANDSDIDGDTLTVTDFGQGAHGTVSYNGDGTFNYRPADNYAGPDSFTYTVTDGNGTQSTATVNIVVNEVNDGPVATDDTVITDEDTPVKTGNVLGNDSDIDGDTLTVTDFSQGEHGTVSYNGDGTFTYTPTANYNGTDSFTYTISDSRGGVSTGTVTVEVNAVNDSLKAVDDSFQTNEDTTIRTGNVMTNDIELDGNSYQVTNFTKPEHGTVVYNGDGSFSYTPDANYNGSDNFTYTITDASGGTSTATINISVQAVNDAPDAQNDYITTAEGKTAISGNVLANDSDIDGDKLQLTGFSQPEHGQVSFNEDGTFTYKPEANYNGSDSFTYTISDGQGGFDTATVTIDVVAVNDAPESKDDHITTDEDTPIRISNLLNNDKDIDGDKLHIHDITQPEHGSITLNNDGTLTYTPDANYNGQDSFTYTVSDDNGGTDTAKVYITVNSVNDNPVADNDQISTNQNQSIVTGNVLANDHDADGDTLQIINVGEAGNGTVHYNDDGTFTYTPDKDFTGTDSFTYTIQDSQGAVSTARVMVTVNTVDSPVVVPDDAGPNKTVINTPDNDIKSTTNEDLKMQDNEAIMEIEGDADEIVPGFDELVHENVPPVSPAWGVGGVPNISSQDATELSFTQNSYKEASNTLDGLLNKMMELPEEVTKNTFDDIYSEDMAYESDQQAKDAQKISFDDSDRQNETLSGNGKTEHRGYLAGIIGLLRSSVGLTKHSDEEEQEK